MSSLVRYVFRRIKGVRNFRGEFICETRRGNQGHPSPVPRLQTLRICCALLCKWGLQHCELIPAVNKCIKSIQLGKSVDLEKRLQGKARKVCYKVKNLNGRARVTYLKEYVLFDISDSDILSSVQLSSQVEALNEELQEEVATQRNLLAVEVNSGQPYDEVQARQKARKV